MHWAVVSGSMETIRTLVQRGARIDLGDRDKQTPLHFAVLFGEREIAEYLVSKNPLAADVLALAGLGRTAELRRRGSLGCLAKAEDGQGNCPLHYAAAGGSLDTVTWLVESGSCKIGSTNAMGQSAMHLAARGSGASYRRIVEWLARHGGNVSAGDDDGDTPLHVAVLNGHLDMVERLLSLGAGVEPAERMSGRTPLHYAALGGLRNIVEALLKHGANPNVRDACGETPLALAEDKETADLLVKHGGMK